MYPSCDRFKYFGRMNDIHLATHLSVVGITWYANAIPFFSDLCCKINISNQHSKGIWHIECIKKKWNSTPPNAASNFGTTKNETDKSPVYQNVPIVFHLVHIQRHYWNPHQILAKPDGYLLPYKMQSSLKSKLSRPIYARQTSRLRLPKWKGCFFRISRHDLKVLDSIQVSIKSIPRNVSLSARILISLSCT